MSIAGGLPGGPAKIAVVASGFEGMISGSSVANVVGSGSVTIPLMKSIGYPAHFAGAVEATASTGGQFMPPVMGAGAFVMAEFLGVPYVRIALLAFIPACLYYFACYMQIHYRAVKMDLKGVPRAQLPKFWGLFKKKFYLLFPIVVLVYFLLNYYSILRVAFLAIVATIIVGLFQKGEDRFTLRSFFETLEVGARTALGVAVACACAGIVVGVITMTGLGLKISTVIIDLSHGILFITLVLSAIVCLIMGMGVPVTASYIIVATIAAPSLLKLGVMPLAAHLFVFYFAVLADITPPVCIAAYVAAGMAGANPMKTGLTATKLGIAAFIVPFVFCYDTALLGLGDVSYIIYRIIITMLGVIALAAGAEMYFLRKNKFYETPLLFVAALLLIKPGWITDLTGIIILSIVILLQFFRGKKETFVYSGLLIRFLNILFRKERE
jgi:TRAP transporter 4TM/12TM fusion protein